MNPARPALELLEEALHLLRMAPARIHALYFAGTIPFLLGFLFFWTEMSRSVNAEDHLIEWSLGLSLLFLWMKCWQSAAASELLTYCARSTRASWNWPRIRRLIYIQGMWQPTKLIGLPLAALLTLPFAWACAFYHQLAMFGDGTVEPPVAYERAKDVAGMWPKQNFMAILWINILGLFVILNIFILGILLPILVHAFTGIESSFSRSPIAFIFNSTFLGAALATAHLCLNPVTMAFYVVRCFHARSVRDGRDLLAELAEERSNDGRARKKPATGASLALRVIVLISACLLLPGPLARAEEGPAATPPPRVKPAEIDRSIKETFERREFAWRMPREGVRPKLEVSKGPIAQFFDRVGSWFGRIGKKIGQWYTDIREWWRRVTSSGPTRIPGEGGSWSFGSLSAAQVLLYVLLILSVGVGIYVAVRQWRLRRVAPVAASPVAPTTPPAVDLHSEDVLATQLPEDEWLRLARELAARGEYRLALRALFLATLSVLAGRGVIAIARHKSNRDYFGELQRRARQYPGWPPAFGECITLFERSWYGRHSADPNVLAAFEAQQQIFIAPEPPPTPAAS